ncbi:MAG: YtoQ family protein, partial [OCS116 cluster bacterium]|nr:YtoQ family protein [OCS116 cluster bacterium]
MTLNVYLSGEIHTDWRQQIENGCRQHDLEILFTSAVTNHAASDAAGDLLGQENNSFWRDHKSAKVNSIRTKVL